MAHYYPMDSEAESVSGKPPSDCPFCGQTPVFDYAPEWMDDRRYMQLKLECCVTMTAALGWTVARDLTEAQANRRLRAVLLTQWDTRYKPEPD